MSFSLLPIGVSVDEADGGLTPLGFWILATGAASVTGTMTVTESADTFAATGTVGHVGTMAVTEGADVFAAAGTVGSSAITGTMEVTEGADVFAAAGTVGHVGVLAETIAAETATGDNGPGLLYELSIMPALAGTYIYYVVTSYPNSGTWTFSPNGSVIATGVADGSYEITFDWWAADINGWPIGNGSVIDDVLVGGTSASAGGGTGTGIGSGSGGNATASVTVAVAATLDNIAFSGTAEGDTSTATAQASAVTGNVVFSGSAYVSPRVTVAAVLDDIDVNIWVGDRPRTMRTLIGAMAC